MSNEIMTAEKRCAILCAILIPVGVLLSLLSCAIPPGHFGYFKLIIGLLAFITFAAGVVTGIKAVVEFVDNGRY